MAEKQKYRTIIFYKDYFQDFFVKQRDKVRDKIIWTLELIEDIQKIPETYLKHMENTDGLYELKITSTLKIINLASKSVFSKEVIFFEFSVFSTRDNW